MCYARKVTRAIPTPSVRPNVQTQLPQPHTATAAPQAQKVPVQNTPPLQKPTLPIYFDAGSDPFFAAGLYDFPGVYQQDPFTASWQLPSSMTIPSTPLLSTPSPLTDSSLITTPSVPSIPSSDFTLYQDQKGDNSLDNWLTALDQSDTSHSDGTTSNSETSPPNLPVDRAKAYTGKRKAASDTDAVLRKRMKNTEAARRSRQRKIEKIDTLEHQVSDLERDKSELSLRVMLLENERKSFRQREQDLAARVADLEKQLAESHRAMLQVGLRSAV